MKVGSLVFATDSGLGLLAKAFFDYGVVTDVMMIPHRKFEEHPEWYSGHGRCSHTDKQRLREFCRSADVMLFFETPFAWELIDWCRDDGIRTVLMPMYECMPDPLPAQPDLFLCPSLLDVKWACDLPLRPGTDVEALPVPVDTKAVPWRQRERAEVFVHNAGHGGLRGRNGTAEFLRSLDYVQSDARFLLRTQNPESLVGAGSITSKAARRLEIRRGTITYDQLWTEGDVFVFPEKFNGLSLPLQEARAAGMLVMATDRFPMNTWLPTAVQLEHEQWCPLIPVKEYRKARVSPRCVEFDEAVVDPLNIAARIDEWYGADIREYSRSGREWAETNSWEALGPKYKALLKGLL